MLSMISQEQKPVDVDNPQHSEQETASKKTIDVDGPQHSQQDIASPKATDADVSQHSEDETARQAPKGNRISHIIYWTPPWCRWSVENPPPFTIWLNILFGLAGGFTTANLSYSYPILNVLANDFRTSQAMVANIPTLAQAGNVTGLLFLLPLADFFPRRKFILTLVFLAAAFW